LEQDRPPLRLALRADEPAHDGVHAFALDDALLDRVADPADLVRGQILEPSGERLGSERIPLDERLEDLEREALNLDPSGRGVRQAAERAEEEVRLGADEALELAREGATGAAVHAHEYGLDLAQQAPQGADGGVVDGRDAVAD